MNRAPKAEVQAFFTARSGPAKLSDLYAHMSGQAASRTVRETSRTVEAMVDTGELVEGPQGEYCLAALPQSSTSRGVVHERLWRTLHRLTERKGGTTTSEMAALAHCTTDAARKWIAAMLAEERAIKKQRPGQRCPQYAVAPEQPSAEQPPAFRWPRRGVAKCRKDREA